MNKKVHKIYLVLALIMGLALSIGMPLFSEPDGQLHYAVASSMVDLSNDESFYGEVGAWGGGFGTKVKPTIQNGTYFENYFERQIRLLPVEKQQRRFAEFPLKLSGSFSILSYVYLGRLVPAIGVWIGHLIYPSMGVMVLFGRTVNMIFLVFLMYLIIKKVKRGKLLFTLLGLNPVILSQFASLSYDGLSYVLVALVCAVAINIIVAEFIQPKHLMWMLLSSIALFFFGKANFLPLLIIYVVLLLFRPVFEAKNLIWIKFSQKIKLSSKVIFYTSITMLVLLGVSLIFAKSLGTFGCKIFLNIIYNFQLTPSYVVNNVNSILVQPLININNMPFWLTIAWAILIFFVCMSENIFVDERKISVASGILAIVIVIGTYFGFRNYSLGFSRNQIMGALAGSQGRYFTPLFFVFPIIFRSKKSRILFDLSARIMIASGLLIILSNGMLIFDTWFSLLYF